MFNAIFRLFMKITGVDRKIIGNPGVRQAMKETARLCSNINTKLEKLEKLT